MVTRFTITYNYPDGIKLSGHIKQEIWANNQNFGHDIISETNLVAFSLEPGIFDMCEVSGYPNIRINEDQRSRLRLAIQSYYDGLFRAEQSHFWIIPGGQ